MPTDDNAPLPVELRDETGLVVGIAAWPADIPPTLKPVLEIDPADPNALLVSWIGGLCEAAAELTFRSTQAGYALRLDVRMGSGGCPAIGIARGLRISTSSPISADSIVVSGLGF